jgi:hypothetical protein
VTSDVDLGWEDVLRRAHRRRRRYALPVAASVAAVAAASAVAVPLLGAEQPRLPVEKIDGSVGVVLDSRTGATIIEYAHWKGHDGICYLVPHVRAACLLRGESSKLYTAVPRLVTRTVDGKQRVGMLLVRRFRIVYTHGGVRLVDAKGRPVPQ